ncbi:MAG TPA: hypothetical protein DHW34_05690 [Actinobacteria bacterium]|nr:hypothetical protein [Actinomycetota bacterium]
MSGIALAMTGDSREIESLAALTQSGCEVSHRCRDVAEVLGLARAGRLTLVVTSPVLAWDAELIAQLRECAVSCIAVVHGDSEEQRWRALGAAATVDVSRSGWPDRMGTAVRRVLTEPVVDASGAEVVALSARTARSGSMPRGRPPSGQLVAIWGPIGSPGRSELATALAQAWGARGARVLLIDADTYGASLHHRFALSDVLGCGLLEACRAARHGRLTAEVLVACSRKVAPHVAVLPGVINPARWAEVGAAALDVVWEQARQVSDVVVVDTGFCLEQDPSDAAITQVTGHRNIATISALCEADAIVAVGRTSALDLERLARGVEQLRESVGVEPRVVVANRAAGRGRRTAAAAEVERVLALVGPVPRVIAVPDRRDASYTETVLELARCVVPDDAWPVEESAGLAPPSASSRRRVLPKVARSPKRTKPAPT